MPTVDMAANGPREVSAVPSSRFAADVVAMVNDTTCDRLTGLASHLASTVPVEHNPRRVPAISNGSDLRDRLAHLCIRDSRWDLLDASLLWSVLQTKCDPTHRSREPHLQTLVHLHVTTVDLGNVLGPQWADIIALCRRVTAADAATRNALAKAWTRTPQAARDESWAAAYEAMTDWGREFVSDNALDAAEHACAVAQGEPHPPHHSSPGSWTEPVLAAVSAVTLHDLTALGCAFTPEAYRVLTTSTRDVLGALF